MSEDLAAFFDPIAAFYTRARRLIAEHGFMVQAVFPTADNPGIPAYAYTVGLWKHELPELVVIGLHPDGQIAAEFLNAAGRRAMANRPGSYTPGDLLVLEDVQADLTWKVGEVNGDWTQAQVTVGTNLGLVPPPTGCAVLQMMWPCVHGHHPDSDEWCHVPNIIQPVLATIGKAGKALVAQPEEAQR